MSNHLGDLDNSNQLVNSNKKTQINFNQNKFENMIKIKYHKRITNKCKPQYYLKESYALHNQLRMVKYRIIILMFIH